MSKQINVMWNYVYKNLKYNVAAENVYNCITDGVTQL
jgi:hypothetical protein